MHTTKTRKKIQHLMAEASKKRRMARIASQAAPIVDGARTEALAMEKGAQDDLDEADGLQTKARLEDLSIWVMEKTYPCRNGRKSTNQYWMASWREGRKVRNVHLGSCKKVSAEEARAKAHELKAQALGIQFSNS
ncbi:MAG: hypothetical protein WA137_06320 [Methanothrix sp.]